MEKTKRIIVGFLGLIAVSVILYTPVFAETNQENISSLQDLVNLIRQKIEEVQAQIEALQLQLRERAQEMRQLGEEVGEEAKEIKKEIKEELKLTKRLWRGLRGKDVFLLQEFLATDPDVYPEGLVTGYFGPLTQMAVKRFQKKMGVEQVGLVGPKTLSKINELLTEGAGSSGKVPPGLLIAPGIRKKISFMQPLPGQKLPPGIAKKLPSVTSTNGNGTTTPDTTAPVISEIMATSTTVSSTQINWLTDEISDSKVWYSTSTPLDLLVTSTLQVNSSDLVISHGLGLSTLNASTTYYYIVSSSDESDNKATSSEHFFTTLSE